MILVFGLKCEVGSLIWQGYNNLMERVVLYAILSSDQVLSSWTHPDCRKYKGGLLERVLRGVTAASVLVRKVHCEEWWVYYFAQDEYLFVLAAAGPERETRMKNYLKVIADLFYELYDQRKFPTVLDCLMTEINRIEGSQNNEQQLQRLTNSNLHSHKMQFSTLLTKRQSTRTYKLAAVLVVCILLLTAYYFSRTH